jgi:hypothetical protein
MSLEKAVETAKYTKHANEPGVARNSGHPRKVKFAGGSHEAFQLLFSRISRSIHTAVLTMSVRKRGNAIQRGEMKSGWSETFEEINFRLSPY